MYPFICMGTNLLSASKIVSSESNGRPPPTRTHICSSAASKCVAGRSEDKDVNVPKLRPDSDNRRHSSVRQEEEMKAYRTESATKYVSHTSQKSLPKRPLQMLQKRSGKVAVSIALAVQAGGPECEPQILVKKNKNKK